MNKKQVILDVREDLKRGREPFSRIMQTVLGLAPEQSLRLIAPFEPLPLYEVLAGQGFAHCSSRISQDHWEVLFSRPDTGAGTTLGADPNGGNPKVIEVDARGLEPPQPLVTILEALVLMPKNAELLARTDRRPMHLYSQLEARGFVGTTVEQSDGSFVTFIRRG